jgi:hypothetical protein
VRGPSLVGCWTAVAVSNPLLHAASSAGHFPRQVPCHRNRGQINAHVIAY